MQIFFKYSNEVFLEYRTGPILPVHLMLYEKGGNSETVGIVFQSLIMSLIFSSIWNSMIFMMDRLRAMILSH